MARPQITSATNAGGNRNVPFSYQIVATNSPTSYDAMISPSGLPPGLSINTATGLLSGTPTAQSSWAINLSATNGDGTGTKTLALHIVAPTGVYVSSTPNATGTQGSPFSYQITGDGAGAPPTSYSATNLPAGLTVDTSTGLISGTPTVSGTFSTGCKIGVTNAAGTDQIPMTYVIAASSGTVPVITSSTSDFGVVGDAYSYQITATNSPTSYNATPLPAGLSVNTATGEITGTPTTVETTAVTLSAINGAGTGTATLSLNIRAVGGVIIPPDLPIPKGIFSYTPVGQLPPNQLKSHPAITGFSVAQSWADIELTQGVYDFETFFGASIRSVAPVQKLLLRIQTGSGFKSSGGNIPDYVATLMGVSATDKHETPGVTYSYDPKQGGSTICNPVFWNSFFWARKKALYQAFGDWLTNTTTLTQAQKDAVVIISISYANIRTEDFNVPHRVDVVSTGGPDGTGWVLSELNRWLHLPGDADPGAGYTTQKMIDIAIRTDNQGLIDVAMNAFPGKFITHASGSNGSSLDAPNDENYLCRTVYDTTVAKYPDRFIIQRNNVSNIMPVSEVATGTAWELMFDEASAGNPVAGQNLSVIWGDTTDTGGNGYRMNGGVDTDPDGILPPPLTASHIYRNSSRKIASYGAFYDEIYEKDLISQSVDDSLFVQSLFGGDPIEVIAPTITSPLTLSVDEGDTANYQITAGNNPDTYAAEIRRAQHVGGIILTTDATTGFLTIEGVFSGDYEITISATNNDGTGSAILAVTVVPPTGGGGTGSPPPAPGTVAVDAFPSLSSTAEADKTACQGYLDKINQGPPSAVRDLVVTTPQRPNSGAATAFWKQPLKR